MSEDLLHILVFIPFVLIWLLIGYQFLLAVGGFIYNWICLRERRELLRAGGNLPNVTILIPAHNEERVIERTVRSLLALDYPADRLSLLVINDASSDATGEILDRMARDNQRVRVLHRTAQEGGRGKADALNAALLLVRDEFVAIYDADNCPEPCALKLLVGQFLKYPELTGAVGKFRTANKSRNLLTRFINVEGLGFQGIMQAGRWYLLGVTALTGTNYVIRRSAVLAVGGWDIEALAEDAELTVRLYQAGYFISYVPYSVTWEQEPETFGVWLKQRTRWARGNNYAFAKLLRTFWQSKSKLDALELLFALSVPYILLFALIASQSYLIIGLCGVEIQALREMPTNWWLYGVLLYYFEVLAVLTADRELTPANMLTTIVMYFTYCQAWPLAYLGALYADVVKREKRIWVKTVRFDTEYTGLSRSDLLEEELEFPPAPERALAGVSSFSDAGSDRHSA